jgi:D-threo-aldose 1-dehydrogenase
VASSVGYSRDHNRPPSTYPAAVSRCWCESTPRAKAVPPSSPGAVSRARLPTCSGIIASTARESVASDPTIAKSLEILASKQKADGAIAGYGLGVNDVEVCLDALTHADLDVILLAGRYTIADQTALTALLPACLARGTRIVLGGPFNSGILATGAQPAGGAVPYFNYAPAAPDVVARVAAIEAVCAAHGVPLKAAALQFPLAHPAVTCVVAGVRSGVEIDDNAAMMARPIPSAFWRDLHAGGLLPADAPVPAAA